MAETISVNTANADWRTVRCGGCDKTWTGQSRCHCSLCHETFSGITAFDSHVRGERHLPPYDVKPKLELRDGIWRNAEARPAGSWG